MQEAALSSDWGNSIDGLCLSCDIVLNYDVTQQIQLRSEYNYWGNVSSYLFFSIFPCPPIRHSQITAVAEEV